MRERPLHLRIALFLMPVAVAFGIIATIQYIEQAFFPVVSDFHVTSMRQYQDRIIMRGYMRKTRNCAFAGVSVFGSHGGEKTPLQLLFLDSVADSHNATRPTGTQPWGPWRISIPVSPEIQMVTLTAIHDCHFAWATKTHLVTFPVFSKREPKE